MSEACQRSVGDGWKTDQTDEKLRFSFSICCQQSSSSILSGCFIQRDLVDRNQEIGLNEAHQLTWKRGLNLELERVAKVAELEKLLGRGGTSS